MDVTLLYFEGCPNWKIANERLNVLALERTDVTVKHRLVETPEQADHAGFFGSPSIQVDGIDLFAEPGSQVGLTCRRYLTPDGYEGAPTLEQLRGVFADAAHRAGQRRGGGDHDGARRCAPDLPRETL